MTMFIIYENPSDYPNEFVVREAGSIYESILKHNPEEFFINPRQELIFRIQPTAVVDTLAEARQAVPKTHFYQIPRDNSGDPVIIETWL